MNEEEKKKKLAELEKEAATVDRLYKGLQEDAKKETDPVRKDDLEAQTILVGRQLRTINSEIEGLKNAPKDSPKRGVRSVFGRR